MASTSRLRLVAVALAGLAPAALISMPSAGAQSVFVRPDQNRPAGLALLFERDIADGKQALGVFGISADPVQPQVWRIKVWEELPNDVKVRSETVQCSPTAPLRVTNDGRNLILRELNPGGVVTPANRIDHLVWWATCFPEQAGKDPNSLRSLALQHGYSGNRVEREQVVPAGNL
ncbi:hypothetical protein [Synechococcus sp. 1G10]|uniref:hypothetical protein n=1 Tax=Synechococcus sp. 1G10 TaxID=2025605 RepID=UPI0018E98CCB|nr:hypothetical protein [Synechococcus sp. 1G10]